MTDSIARRRARRAGAEILGHGIAELRVIAEVRKIGDSQLRVCAPADGQPCLIPLQWSLLQPPNELRLVSRPQKQGSCHLGQCREPPLLDQLPKESERFRSGKLTKSIGNNNLVTITIHSNTLDIDADEADGLQQCLSEVQYCSGDDGKTINR
jgi:hypothetical protein